MSSARITSFLVKIASRCNLDCDYCYMYHHADQSWRKMPRLLSEEHRAAFSARLAEYVAFRNLNRVAVILHGGEPLLAGYAAIVEFSRRMRSAVGPDIEVDVGLQTNGLLLTDAALDAFEAERVAVSLSMDGPREAHDLHRTTRRGRSSFDKVQSALDRLSRRPSVFAGVIAVIDPSVPPQILLSYFAERGVPKLDFLLPDSHHENPPTGRMADPMLYERWLVGAFDCWLDSYPELPVRTFEALLDAVSGLPSGTDAFGLGDVSLVSLETDGTWHDLDVFKVAGEGATRLVGNVEDTSIEQLASSSQISAHRRLLTVPGLCDTCRSCDVVAICGGGSVPHRFGGGGFENPTVYCGEMKALIAHVRRRLVEGLADAQPLSDDEPGFDVDAFELAETSDEIVSALRGYALAEAKEELRHALSVAVSDVIPISDNVLASAARRAGTNAWQRARLAAAAGRVVRDFDGMPVEAGDDYIKGILEARRPDLEIGYDDEWLRKPFGAGIVFEEEQIASEGRRIVEEALDIIDGWRPALGRELRSICSAVQFVRDPSAHPDKIVSFSDDSVPGALFVSVIHGDRLIDPYDLADSLVHEHRHQKLYLFERRYPTTAAGVTVVSPWREDLRPTSGLLHAVFVFVELRRFWENVRDRGPRRLHNRAIAQLEDTECNLGQAFQTLRTAELTVAGRRLADVLESRRRRVPVSA